MLKLKVMQLMTKVPLIIMFLMTWFSGFPQLDLVRISSPTQGEYLQGIIQIIGTVTGNDLARVEVSFRYQDNQSESWFLIDQFDEPIVDDVLARWDTSTIADGEYQIRVLAVYSDGREQEAIIKNLFIRNYTPFDPIKTENPALEQTLVSDDMPAITTITPTLRSSPTPMPPNEIIVTEEQFLRTAVQGAILGILFLFVIVMFIIIRSRKLG